MSDELTDALVMSAQPRKEAQKEPQDPEQPPSLRYKVQKKEVVCTNNHG